MDLTSHHVARWAFCLLVTVAAAGCTPQRDAARPDERKTIYGDDSRRDWFEIESSRFRELADSSVALISDENLRPDKKGFSRLRAKTFRVVEGVCAEERFSEQPAASFCSGVLIAPRRVLTAGHCIAKAHECRRTRFVFGFAVREKGVLPDRIPDSEIYHCSRIIHSETDSRKHPELADFALIELDRDVEGHRPALLDERSDPRHGDALVVFGYPRGLPLKLAEGFVRQMSQDRRLLVATLDTYNGNSGSPVFDARSGLLQGILVDGDEDFIDSKPGECRLSKHCPDEGCKGEQITSVLEILTWLNNSSGVYSN